MPKKLTLHLQQNTTLERVVNILDFFNSQQTDIEQLSAICDLKVAVLQKNIFPFLRNISILEKNPTRLTSLGKVAAEIQQLNPAMLGDFLHLLIYSLHLQDPDKRFSWAYATVVQQLWLRKEVILSANEKKSIVGEVIEKAAQQFGIPISEIAFSEFSVAGVLNWLKSLSPTVIESPTQSKLYFNRRYFCAAPILLKAVDILYQQSGRTYGVKIFLREEIQEQLCQILLLDTSGLDSTLDNAKRTYDYDQGGFFDYGYEGGYGQWVMITKSPKWSELL
ncbi:MAG TPA: hypothetical protein V6D15_18420 [Oculatellaceae cyanobacterium]|jgi:hypothetical protein